MYSGERHLVKILTNNKRRPRPSSSIDQNNGISPLRSSVGILMRAECCLWWRVWIFLFVLGILPFSKLHFIDIQSSSLVPLSGSFPIHLVYLHTPCAWSWRIDWLTTYVKSYGWSKTLYAIFAISELEVRLSQGWLTSILAVQGPADIGTTWRLVRLSWSPSNIILAPLSRLHITISLNGSAKIGQI